MIRDKKQPIQLQYSPKTTVPKVQDVKLTNIIQDFLYS